MASTSTSTSTSNTVVGCNQTTTTTMRMKSSILLHVVLHNHHRHRHCMVFSITTLLSFIAYFTTVSPSVAGGDSGELLAEGCQLGTSHPPGYPLYVLIVYVVTTMGRWFVTRTSACTTFGYGHGYGYGYGYGNSEMKMEMDAEMETDLNVELESAFFVNVTSCIFGAVASGLVASSVLFLTEANSAQYSRRKKWRDKRQRLMKRFHDDDNDDDDSYDAKKKKKNDDHDEDCKNQKAMKQGVGIRSPNHNPRGRKRNNRGQFVSSTSKDKKHKGRDSGKKKQTQTQIQIQTQTKYCSNDDDDGNNDKDDAQSTMAITTITNASIAIVVGILNTLSPLTWQYSITAEVFALHNLCIAFMLHSTIRFALNPCVRLLQLGAFACGIALTNQHTSILLSVPLIVWVCYGMGLYHPRNWIILSSQQHRDGNGNGGGGGRASSSRSFHVLWQVSIYFLSSFVLLYATMPLFATLFPHAGSWGDVTNLTGFLRHFLRKDYGTLQLFSGNDHGAEHWITRTYLWAKDYTLVQLPSPLFACFFVIGCAESISKEMIRWSFMKQFHSRRKSGVERQRQRLQRSCTSKKDGNGTKDGRDNDDTFPPIRLEGPGIEIVILFSLVFYLVIFHSLSNLPLNNELYFGIHQRFWMQPNMICHIFIGLGLSKVMNCIPKPYLRPSCLASILLLIGIVSGPLREGLTTNDQSDNYFMSSYARSILATLPPNSVLFINYDQQWTSVRYIQECEGSYDHVTSINLSMMSYKWWNTKHDLYKDIDFPGTHYTDRGVGGFTFEGILDANYDKFRGNIFIGGNLPYMEPGYLQKYEEIPHGIVRKVKRKRDGKSSNDHYSIDNFQSQSSSIWNIVMEKHSRGLPDASKYSPDTWESTIVREFYDHFVSRATHLLDLTVSHLQGGKHNTKYIEHLVEAIAWLELARMNDELSKASPASILKNLGLGYMHMVRSMGNNEELPNVDDLLDKNIDNFMSKNIEEVWWDGTGDWKTWASTRWVECWSRFLEADGSRLDPSYEAVQSIYDTVMRTVTSK